MSFSYCVGLVYRHAVLVRRVELSNDVQDDPLMKLSEKCLDRRRILTFGGLSRNPTMSQPNESSRIMSTMEPLRLMLDNTNGDIQHLEAENRRLREAHPK